MHWHSKARPQTARRRCTRRRHAAPEPQPAVCSAPSLSLSSTPLLLQFVGYSQDSRLPAEFDVTPLLKPGAANTLAVQARWRWRGARPPATAACLVPCLLLTVLPACCGFCVSVPTGAQVERRQLLGGSGPVVAVGHPPVRRHLHLLPRPCTDVLCASSPHALSTLAAADSQPLCRDVYLLAKPSSHIADFHVRTPLAWGAASGGPPEAARCARAGVFCLALLCCAAPLHEPQPNGAVAQANVEG